LPGERRGGEEKDDKLMCVPLEGGRRRKINGVTLRHLTELGKMKNEGGFPPLP